MILSEIIQIKQISAEDTWPLRHRVMYSNEPFEFVKLPDDTQGIHFGLFENNRLVTIVSLFVKNNELQFRKLATETSRQGNGYGSMMMQHIFDYAEKIFATKIWCNARVNKAKFYKKFGFVETGFTYVSTGIKFVVMEKALVP